MHQMTKRKFTLATLLTASLMGQPLVASAFPETPAQDTQRARITAATRAPTTYAQWQQFLSQDASRDSSPCIYVNHFEEGRKIYERLNKGREWFETARAFATRISPNDPYLAFNAWQSVYMCATALWPGVLSSSREAAIDLVLENDQMLHSVCESFASGLVGYNRFSGLSRIESMNSSVEMSSAGLFQTFMTTYAKRTLDNGTYALKDGAFMASLLIHYQKSPLSWMTTRTTDWDLKLLQSIAAKTPDLLPHDRALLKSHISLFEEDINQSYGRRPQGKAFYEKIIQDLKPFETQDASNMLLFRPATYYAHVAKAHFALGQGQECVKAWSLLHALEDNFHQVGFRYLGDAMRHLSIYCDTPQLHTKYWHSFLQESGLRLDNFRPTFFEIEVLSLPTAPSQWIELNRDYVAYLEALVAYLEEEGADLNITDLALQYDHAYHATALRLANIYISLGNYGDAAIIYKNYFSTHNNMVRMTPQMERICHVHNLLPTTQNIHYEGAVVSFAQAGLLTLDRASPPATTKAAHPSRGKAKARPASRTASSKAAISPAKPVRAHLISHYTKRADEMLTTLGSLVIKLKKTTSADICQEAQALLENLSDLKARLSAQHANLAEAASNAQDLPKLGQEIDTLTQTFGAIRSDCEKTLKAHALEARKAYAAHLETLRANDSSLHPFEAPRVQATAPTPRKSKGKKKTRGTTNPSFAGASTPASSSSAPASSAARAAPLFLSTQAQKDYDALSPDLASKFHSFSREIATNPYGILGTQGRTERLTGLNGTFFSRRLTDGDRVVYEVVKGEDGTVRVTFVSLLGHYKHLARQVASQSVTPFGDSSPVSSSSSSSSSSSHTE